MFGWLFNKRSAGRPTRSEAQPVRRAEGRSSAQPQMALPTKVIAVDANEWLHDSKTISHFHYYMFHGMWDSGNLKTVDPQSGEERINLMRNCHVVPPIVQIHSDLYVSARVKAKLDDVPGVTFQRVNFTRLVDYPWAKGDFSFFKTPIFQAVKELHWDEFFDDFHRKLADIPEYHQSIEPYYKLEYTPHFMAEELDPDARRFRIGIRESNAGTVRIRLSPRMMQQYPITWDMMHFFAEEVFRRIEADFDWDFFVKKEILLVQQVEEPETEEPPPPMIARLGGYVVRDPEKANRPVIQINLKDTPTTDADLGELAAFPDLQELILDETQVTDDGLALLAPLTQLVKLELNYTPLTDAGLRHLVLLPRLEHLGLNGGNHVTDEGLKELARLSRLKRLSVAADGVTDAGLLHLLKAPGLESVFRMPDTIGPGYLRLLAKMQPETTELDLQKTAVGDHDLKELARFSTLQTVDLRGTPVTEAGLVHLLDLPTLKKVKVSNRVKGDDWLKLKVKLKPAARILDATGSHITAIGLTQLYQLNELNTLFLCDVPLTEAAVPVLAQLKQLRILNVRGTGITRRTFAILEKALPNCEIRTDWN
jgi:hypothetical protein